MGAVMDLPTEGLVAGATKPVSARWELPTVLNLIVFQFLQTSIKQRKWRENVNKLPRKTKKHPHGRLQGQVSKKHILEDGC